MSILSLLHLSASIAVGSTAPIDAAAQAQEPNYGICIQLSGAGLTKDGAYVFAKNTCQICVRFSPRVHGPDGAIEPVSTTVALGQPVWDVALQPGASTNLSYASPPGTWTPVTENPRAC